jgi:hypothetical protein
MIVFRTDHFKGEVLSAVRRLQYYEPPTDGRATWMMMMMMDDVDEG